MKDFTYSEHFDISLTKLKIEVDTMRVTQQNIKGSLMKKVTRLLALGAMSLVAGLGLSACETSGGTYNNGVSSYGYGNNGYRTTSYSEASVTTGRVVDIQEVVHQRSDSGVGAVLGVVAGGLLGNQIGRGNGRTLATIGGAVGGGFAGNAIEKNRSPNVQVVITVRSDRGRILELQQKGTSLRIGDRVQVTQEGSNIQILRLN